MSAEAEVERLKTLNARLANQLVNMSDRLQESARQIAAKAWDEGWEASEDHSAAMHYEEPMEKPQNPYRKDAA